MPQHIEATATEPPPAKDASAAKPAGWKLVEQAPSPELPSQRDRVGAARGMVLLLLGGGLFWGAVAAAIWFASR